MPLKRSLLLACTTLAASSLAQWSARAAPAPAPLFTEASPAPASKAPPASPSPFSLEAPKASPSAPGDIAAPRPAGVDLSALRYFAAHNDLGRVSAEIRLLRAKNPSWEPPADLFSEPGSGVDEQPMWDLFAKHDLSAVHAKIQEMRADKPDWQPSADLAGKLALAEAHDALARASDARQWGTVIDTAAANPALLTCGDIDALWRTAEALVRTGDERRAVAAYQYVLSTCTPPDLRLATVQKASLLLTSPDDLDGLIHMGLRAPDGTGEFDGVRLDLQRRKIGEAAAGTGTAPPSPQDIDAVAASATRPGGASDAQLLGWYARSRKDFGGAERWFKVALDAGPNAKAAEGLVLAQRDAGNTAEARQTAVRYADLDPANRGLLVDIEAADLADAKARPPSPEELAALAKAIDEVKSSNGAQAMAWHLFKAGDIAGAEGWFRKSADWQSNESAAIGLVVSARRLHHDRDYAARIAEYRTAYPRIAELEKLMASRPAGRQVARAGARPGGTAQPLIRAAGVTSRRAGDPSGGWDRSAETIAKAYDDGQYETAISLLQQRNQARAEPRGLAVIRGWALYHKGDWEGAKQVFSNLDGGQYSQERAEGLRVIQQGYTNPRLR